MEKGFKEIDEKMKDENFNLEPSSFNLSSVNSQSSFVKFFSPQPSTFNLSRGFTLLEVLVAIAILGIAVAVIFQLFSANMKAIAASGYYVSAAAKAEAKMREVLDDKELTEKSTSEVTSDGYRVDVSVNNSFKGKTEGLPIDLLNISLTVRWMQGSTEKSYTLTSMKVITKKI